MSRNLKEKIAEEDLRISHIDFSSRRQSLIDGVIRVITEAIEHLKTSLILPKMLEKPEVLIKVLTGTQFESAIKLVADFQRRREIILKEQRRPLMDHGMIHIIDYFQYNTEINKILHGYSHGYMTDEDRKILKAFEMLLETAKRHLNRQAPAQINEEKRLFKIYKESKTLKKSIDKLRFKIASHQTTLRWKMAAKAVYLKKAQIDQYEKQQEMEKRIERETDETQRAARHFKKISLEKQNQLGQELDRMRTEYKNLSKENKQAEKHNREEKAKLIIQLEGAIRKYDTAISEKINENLELEDKLKEAKKKLSEFMVVYRKEEHIYHEIVVKREERIEHEKRQRIFKYMTNRAARQIQKYWRNWQKEQKLKEKRAKKKNEFKVLSTVYFYICLAILGLTKMSPPQTSQTSISQIAENIRNGQFGTNPLTTQINCVIRVIKESIEYVKISLILPQILGNPTEARKVLNLSAFQPALRLLDDYILRRDIIIKGKRTPLSDHGMIKIMDYFLRNHKMHELFPDMFDKLTKNDRDLLITFERLFQICEQKLLRRAKKEINNERKLNKIYHENEAVKNSIMKLKADMVFQVAKEHWQMAATRVCLQKCEEKLTREKQKNERRMRDESERCHRIIQANQKSAADEQNALEIELKQLREEFEKQVKLNLREEKNCRDEKNKLEIKLQADIKKYDETICQKIVKGMDLQKHLQESAQQMDILMVKYRKCEAIYNDIVVKREEEEEFRKRRRILNYMRNRAARKIQRFWRKWRRYLKEQLRRERRILRKQDKKMRMGL
ncbi:hypothetical protein ACLKA6_014570 [Drosophila palustris]